MGKLRNKYVIITSKRRFDVIITYLLRTMFAGFSLQQGRIHLFQRRWMLHEKTKKTPPVAPGVGSSLWNPRCYRFLWNNYDLHNTRKNVNTFWHLWIYSWALCDCMDLKSEHYWSGKLWLTLAGLHTLESIMWNWKYLWEATHAF